MSISLALLPDRRCSARLAGQASVIATSHKLQYAERIYGRSHLPGPDKIKKKRKNKNVTQLYAVIVPLINPTNHILEQDTPFNYCPKIQKSQFKALIVNASHKA